MAVRTVAFIREAGVESYELALIAAGLLAGPGMLTVLVWDLDDTPGADANTWRVHSWVQSDADAATLRAVLISRGPDNVPNPGCAVFFFRNDEPQTGAGKYTAPAGGWFNATMFVSPEARLRSPDDLKMDDRLLA
jgi:hypothetical protein